MKVELKHKWTKYWVLSTNGNDSADTDDVDKNKIIFDINDAKLNKELSKLLGKRLERSVYWNQYLAKSQNKNTTNNYWYFRKSNFAGVNKIFFLVYSNEDDNGQRYKAKMYYLPKGIIRYLKIGINRKDSYNQLILIKRYK